MAKTDIKKKKALSQEINSWLWNNRHYQPNHDWAQFDLKTLKNIRKLFK